jgi:hypothetical protein
MIEKEAAKGVVVAGFDHLSCAAIFSHPNGFPTTGAVQGEPPPAGLEPLPYDLILHLVWVRAGDIGNQQLAVRQPLCNVGKIIGDGRAQARVLLQKLQDPQPGIVHVMPGGRTGRVSSDNGVYSNGFGFTHLIAMPPISIWST